MDIELREVPITAIRINRDNPRFALGDLTELARSILAKGIIQPLIVRPVSALQYILLDGHRRLAAAQIAGLTTVPVLCRPDNPTLVALVTGGHHRPLKPLEMARGFGKLQAAGCTQAQICRLTGYSPSTVSARLALLALDAATMDRVDRGLVRPEDALAAVRAARSQTPKGLALTNPRDRAGGQRRPAATRIVTPYFGPQHPLARQAADRCKHRSTLRRDSSTVACGECWEATIRDDERRQGPALEASA